MATEQDDRPGDGVLNRTDRPAHREPWSWKVDISSLVLSIVALGAIIGLLAGFDGEFRGFRFWSSSHWLRFGIGCLLLVVYFFLLIPLSDSLYRIKLIHSSYPSWASTSDEAPAKLRQPFKAIRTFFTSNVLGIAPAPTLILLVAAAVAVVPWTIALVEYRHIDTFTPQRFERYTGANLAVARRLDADIYKDWYYPELETIHAAVWKGFTGATPETSARCWGYGGYAGVSCKWEEYATLQVRVQCGNIDQDLELSSARSIFRAMRDLDSLPPYDPRNESRASHPSPSILSLKGNTFVTLSNLRSYTGPWHDSTDENLDPTKKKPRQISKGALKKLNKFSSFVVNPVDSRKIKNPLFNQTAGVLGNFHIIQAELGISGYYDAGELQWIEIEKGDTRAWECTVDTVVQEKSAFYDLTGLSDTDLWWYRQAILPSTKELSNRTCLDEPDSCSGKNREDIMYNWHDKTFAVDRRITDAISYELEPIFLGSAFAQGWHSQTGKALEVLQSSSQSMLFIYHGIQSTLSWNALNAFGTIGDVLTWWMRRHNLAYCRQYWGDKNKDMCDGFEVVGQTREESVYYHVVWEFIAYPVVLIITTLLAMFAAAVDGRVHRIRLSDNDHAADENDGLLSSTPTGAGEGNSVEAADTTRN